jgi:inner membrane protein
VDDRQWGDIPLSRCDLGAARERDSHADAFLFWSRAPFVERLPSGEWRLGDARFASRGGSQFSVVLPASACDPG